MPSISELGGLPRGERGTKVSGSEVNVLKRIEQERIFADPFVDAVLIPTVRSLRDKHARALSTFDVLEPLTDEYLERGGGSFSPDAVWFAVQNRIIRAGDEGNREEKGLLERIQGGVDRWLDVLAQYRNGDKGRLFPVRRVIMSPVGSLTIGALKEHRAWLTGIIREMEREIAKNKERGGQALAGARERVERFMQENGIESKAELYNFLTGQSAVDSSS